MNELKDGGVAAKIEAHTTLISPDTLAGYLGLSRKSIYARVKSGTLPAIRLGGSIRFDPATTAKWLRARAA